MYQKKMRIITGNQVMPYYPRKRSPKDKYMHQMEGKGRNYIISLCNVLIRNDMDVNEHERLSNITLRYKVK